MSADCAGIRQKYAPCSGSGSSCLWYGTSLSHTAYRPSRPGTHCAMPFVLLCQWHIGSVSSVETKRKGGLLWISGSWICWIGGVYGTTDSCIGRSVFVCPVLFAKVVRLTDICNPCDRNDSFIPFPVQSCLSVFFDAFLLYKNRLLRSRLVSFLCLPVSVLSLGRIERRTED